MRMVPIYPKPQEGLRVLCILCNQWVTATEALADLDGEPFKAYYHAGCAEEAGHNAPEATS